MEPVAVIPARYGSTRLPGKPLSDLCGKPLIQRVYEQVRQAEIFSRIVVATDSEPIFRCVESFGGEALMTSAHHRCGTERIAEAAESIEAEFIFNVQGDEPFLHPGMLRQLWKSFQSETVAVMGTFRHPLTRMADLSNPNVVKVVTDEEGFALYFSRSPIPYPGLLLPSKKIDEVGKVWYKHVGVYAYRRDFLLRYPSMKMTSFEECEGLEQLRALAYGYRIRVYTTSWETLGIDTEEDLAEARSRWMDWESKKFFDRSLPHT